MKILLVNNAEKGIDDYCVPLEHILRSKSFLFKRIEYPDILRTDRSAYNGFILSGSPCGNDIVEYHLPYFRWINDMDKPVLGICAGHHIIGALYGATLIRDSQSEVGDSTITVLKKDPVFEGLEQEMLVAQAHHDSITLPKKFILLASSKKCPVQAMKHEIRPLYSTQFHPETHNPRIIRNFLELVKWF